MTEPDELARSLTDYDERLAAAFLECVCTELGGPAADGDFDVERMRAFLGDPEAARTRLLERIGDVSESPASTAEWKSEFARSERLRALGLELAERLSAARPG